MSAGPSDWQELIRRVEAELQTTEREASVFTLDIPDAPQQNAVIVAVANPTQAVGSTKDRVMGVCFGVNANLTGQDHFAFLAPEYSAAGYFALYEGSPVDEPPSGNVTVVEQPKHGVITYLKYEDQIFHHAYVPNPGYVGDERFVVTVNVDGKSVKLIYLIKVSKTEVGNQSDDVFCSKTGTQWKISSSGSISKFPADLMPFAATWPAWLSGYAPQAGFSEALGSTEPG